MLSLFRRTVDPVIPDDSSFTITPMIYAEISAVMQIEKQCFPKPWAWTVFDDAIAFSNRRPYTLRKDGLIIGYSVAEMGVTASQITNLAVRPEFRRQGGASMLINHHLDSLGGSPGSSLFVEVRESNLPAQLLFKKLGFQWITTYRSGYADTEDSYLMQFRIGTHKRAD